MEEMISVGSEIIVGSGVETYTDTPDWSGQSFGEITLDMQSGMINSIWIH